MNIGQMCGVGSYGACESSLNPLGPLYLRWVFVNVSCSVNRSAPAAASSNALAQPPQKLTNLMRLPSTMKSLSPPLFRSLLSV